MFYPNEQFPFTRLLEKATPLILSELDSLKDSFQSWSEKELYDQKWDVYPLLYFGKKEEEHCAHFPKTTALAKHIPGLVNAAFSRLGAKSSIKPHKGITDRLLRCHLGLVTPLDCALRVGSETKSWESGKAFVFDDMQEHEAWNKSDQDRIVLIVDFLKDPTGSIDDLKKYQKLLSH